MHNQQMPTGKVVSSETAGANGSPLPSPPAAPVGGDGSAGGSGGRTGGLSDRVFGGIVLALAIWYVIEAQGFTGSGFSSGPVGPKTFPTGVGVLFGLGGLYLIIRPDRPPRWPSKAAAVPIIAVLIASYLYGIAIRPIGFIASSAVMAIVIGLLFKGPIKYLVPLAIAFPIVMAYIFNNWLSLRLPAGIWGGF